MVKKKVAGVKSGKNSKRAVPAASAAAPSIPDTPAHLKNKKLHGLEFGLTQRNNILIDCWAVDRVPREVIIACFENAGIYPPEASGRSLKTDASQPTRSSRRINKQQAVQDIQALVSDNSLNNDQKLVQCSLALEGIMDLAKCDAQVTGHIKRAVTES